MILKQLNKSVNCQLFAICRELKFRILNRKSLEFLKYWLFYLFVIDRNRDLLEFRIENR